MESGLERIADWDQRLEQAQWQAKALADMCGIGERELRRFIHAKFRLAPHAWILQVRMVRAATLLAQGLTAKEVGLTLGYKQPSHFSREFKRFYGASPASFKPRGF